MRTPLFWVGVGIGAAVVPVVSIVTRLALKSPLLYPR